MDLVSEAIISFLFFCKREANTSETENFRRSGPVTLKKVDWTNRNHRRSVAASLVQCVYVLERDRQKNRKGRKALAPPWWETFNFQSPTLLIDDADSSVFGAIYQLTSTSSDPAPLCVVAFRGTLLKRDTAKQDIRLDIDIILNELHQTSRFKKAIQAVHDAVQRFGETNVWIAGHSLGAAIALLVGKSMAKSGVLLYAYLFNPPFVSVPFESFIKDKRMKHGLRIAGSVITAGFALALRNDHQTNPSGSTSADLSAWSPCLFVNPRDYICSEYTGYFKHRQMMEEIGAGAIARLATKHSIWGLCLNALGKPSHEPLHRIPSATVMVNRTSARAHGILQWCPPDLHLEATNYSYVRRRKRDMVRELPQKIVSHFNKRSLIFR